MFENLVKLDLESDEMTANGMNNQPVNNGLNSHLYASTFENKPNYY